MGANAYRKLLVRREIVLVLTGAITGGLLTTALPLAIVLLVADRHSFADAGAVVAACILCAGLSSPFRGRLVDRSGQTRVLAGLALLETLAVVALAVLTVEGAPLWLLAACAAAAGACQPPLLAAMRTLWKVLVQGEAELQTAYALQAVLNEVLFMLGPLAAAGLAAVLTPATGIVVLAVGGLIGVLAFCATNASRGWRAGPRHVGLTGALDAPGMRTLAAAHVPIGMTFGVLDVGVPAFAGSQGSTESGGFALAALAAGSIAGGLAFGSREWRGRHSRRLLLMLAVFTLCLAPLGLVDGMPALIALLGLAGIPLAAAVATIFRVIDDVAPGGTDTEAMNWILATYALGSASGAALAGVLAAHTSVRVALLSASVCSVFALLFAAVRVRTLEPST